jgi:hypothetical protein
MIAPSTRYVPLLLGVSVLLALPMIRSRFELRRVEDCAHPSALMELGRLPGSGRIAERYEKYDLDVRQWTEAKLRPQGPRMKLRAVMMRSFRPIDLYTRPPAKLLGPIESSQRRIDRVEVDGEELPIQTVRDSSKGRHTLASWLFLYEGEPVQRPLWSQLRHAASQVWSGTRPLTLLLVAGPVDPSKGEQARELAQRWIVDAYRLYRDACAVPDAPSPPRGS